MSEELESVAQVDPTQDGLLAQLVRFANLGVEMDLTLHMGGLMVSGRTVSGAKYFRVLAEALGSEPFAQLDDNGRVVGEAVEETQEISKHFAEIGEHLYGEGGLAAQHPEQPPSFIHLEKVHFNSARPGNAAAALWRGRLAAVDGFFLGFPEPRS